MVESAEKAQAAEHFQESSPVGAWIRRQVLPQLGVVGPVAIRSEPLPSSHRAVRCGVYANGAERAAFVLKRYFEDPGVTPETAVVRARREHRMFQLVNEHVAFQSGHRVARLLGAHLKPPAALAFEYVPGVEAASAIKSAADPRRSSSETVERARSGLRQIGVLLAELHAHEVAVRVPIWLSPLKSYPRRLLHRLAADGVVSEAQYGVLSRRLKSFLSVLSKPNLTLVHGDANPTNFLLCSEGVLALDLERMGTCDPALDLGFMMADLIHLVRQYGGTASLCGSLTDGFATAYSVASKAPTTPESQALFLAIGLWRIARNGWLDLTHRRWLASVSRLVLQATEAGHDFSIGELWG
ncbi:MAG TPA: aminoglycoside phosphotransferase family protein [Polyangiaceae bacterium]|jgi:aminoglycoside phosphotransferase (APT) family kinase protein